jgi:excisionase family DNA binding protein
VSDAFLTVFDVAELLQLNPQTVRNWIDQGSLAAIRVGQRRVRIRQSDLDRFLDAGTTSGTPSGAATRRSSPGETLTKRGVANRADRSGVDPADYAELADALARTFDAAGDEDRAALEQTLRALSRSAERLADAL